MQPEKLTSNVRLLFSPSFSTLFHLRKQVLVQQTPRIHSPAEKIPQEVGSSMKYQLREFSGIMLNKEKKERRRKRRTAIPLSIGELSYL
jgi:hypothetical protein